MNFWYYLDRSVALLMVTMAFLVVAQWMNGDVEGAIDSAIVASGGAVAIALVYFLGAAGHLFSDVWKYYKNWANSDPEVDTA